MRHFQYFRMSAGAFDDLLRRVAPHIQHKPSHSAPVSVAERLAVTLRYLATGMSQQALAASYKLGTATVSCIVREVCAAIWTALEDEFVAFPQGEQWEGIRREFWEMWNYPNCIGAIHQKCGSNSLLTHRVYLQKVQPSCVFFFCLTLALGSVSGSDGNSAPTASGGTAPFGAYP
ncbi:Protein ANTAGONIST OF LIKE HETEROCHROMATIN PROTEIN 1 [Merluccius polli]|uniref:Protein ANTAGONIST OF LIKE HETEROCHROMATIN PROTEIN 1 n=1 Tax=Merluccius polli TaxID=89951 RepID=A0AA47M368_MERPO|nr:Protein ANTAGONIST OF LIKE HETEROCHROMATIN PROTEIN 1 [Merluccius polli]